MKNYDEITRLTEGLLRNNERMLKSIESEWSRYADRHPKVVTVDGKKAVMV